MLRRVPVSLSCEENMPRRVPVSLSCEENMPRRMPVPLSYEENMPRRMSVPLSYEENMPRRMPVPLSNEENMPRRMSVPLSHEENIPVFSDKWFFGVKSGLPQQSFGNKYIIYLRVILPVKLFLRKIEIMKKLSLLLLLICFSYCLHAQDSTAIIHGRLKPNRIYMGVGAICNDSILTTCDLKDRLINNPAAYKEYNKYTSVKKTSGIFGALFFAGLVGGVATLNSKNNVSGKFFLASFVPLFLGVHINNHSQKHLKKAIDIYNSQY